MVCVFIILLFNLFRWISVPRGLCAPTLETVNGDILTTFAWMPRPPVLTHWLLLLSFFRCTGLSCLQKERWRLLAFWVSAHMTLTHYTPDCVFRSVLESLRVVTLTLRYRRLPLNSWNVHQTLWQMHSKHPHPRGLSVSPFVNPPWRKAIQCWVLLTSPSSDWLLSSEFWSQHRQTWRPCGHMRNCANWVNYHCLIPVVAYCGVITTSNAAVRHTHSCINIICL